MHMADALISPAVGGAMWAATGALIGVSAKQLQRKFDDRRVPLMGVAGAFIFAAQMINFTIPGTGSSGHLGGGMMLAILLGPQAAFLTIASVLTIQALFFADGGLLALGCNMFNLGVFPCFLAYPFLYKPLAGNTPTKGRIMAASLLASIVGLQLGAFGVVTETMLSGISALPFRTFVMLMQPIHLAIGIVEGLATAAVVLFINEARPELFATPANAADAPRRSLKPVMIGLGLAALLTAGVVSWFASARPDGLEWAMFRAAGTEELESPSTGVHASLAAAQSATAILPDYNFKQGESAAKEGEEAWPAVNAGTSVAGLVGGALMLLIVTGIGAVIRKSASRAVS